MMSMTDFHISTFHAIMAIGMLFLDIPTGVFADKTGPKKSIILGYLTLSLAFLAYVLSYFTSFWVAILGASLLFALSNGFRSGASESYIFSLHKRIGKESEYLSYMSRLGLITSISTALAAIV
jgi:MFS family permease